MKTVSFNSDLLHYKRVLLAELVEHKISLSEWFTDSTERASAHDQTARAWRCYDEDHGFSSPALAPCHTTWARQAAGHDLPSYPGPTFQFVHLDDIWYIEDSNITVFLFPGNPSVVWWLYWAGSTTSPKLALGRCVQKTPPATEYALQIPILRLDLSQVLMISEEPGRG